MSDSATLTIEMSISAISAAAIAAIVIAALLPWIGLAGCGGGICFACLLGVDHDLGAHARAEHAIAAIDELDLDRHALGDLDEVARRVVGGQQRKPRAGARGDRLDRAMELAGERVDLDVDGLTGADVLELGLLEVGADPGVGGV